MGEYHVDHIVEALDYAQRAAAGEIPACKWVRAAARRHLDDLERSEGDPEYPFEFRPDVAARVISFCELLRHVKGRWAGTRLILQPWQKWILANVFGWVRRTDGRRRFRTVYLEVPRKNAKSTLLGAVGLYMLTADGEFGAEVYSAATTRDQAKLVFEIAQQMARFDGLFRSRFGLDVLQHSIVVRATGSKMAPLSAEGSTLDGLNISAALIDELHAHRTPMVHDVLDSATGSRDQPLIFKITTAGGNRDGICYMQRSYVCKILNDVLRRHGGMGYRAEGDSTEDDSVFGVIYTIDDEDDKFDEATWAKANPNYGISVDPEDMRRASAVAKVETQPQREFFTKRLNVWLNASQSWLNMAAWDACGQTSLKPEDFAGEKCWIGLDAAWKRDLFAKVMLFERDGLLYAFGRYYVPEANVWRKGNEQWQAWVSNGWIRTTPGETLDIEAVREELLQNIAAYDVVEVPFDPHNLRQFQGEMQEHGALMVEMPQRKLHYSEPMKELERMIIAKKIFHNNDPVLTWCMSNVVCQIDKFENIYPVKERSTAKIDGAVALIMALSRWMFREKPEEITERVLAV